MQHSQPFQDVARKTVNIFAVHRLDQDNLQIPSASTFVVTPSANNTVCNVIGQMDTIDTAASAIFGGKKIASGMLTARKYGVIQ